MSQIEQRLREIAHTQNELREAVNILCDVLWKMGHYIHQHSTDENLKSHLRDLGGELKRIKEPRKR